MATFPIFAPVTAIPQLTSGRNLSGYISGHMPKFVLDNDPDTWWQPNTTSTSSLYIDLQNSVPVDGIALWLHDYNNPYNSPKSWKIYASTDDITYFLRETLEFENQRTAQNEPVVVGALTGSPVTARYWKIEFVNFSSSPPGYPKISCVWFLNDYSLTHNFQLPEQIDSETFTVNKRTRSEYSYPTLITRGKQRRFDCTLILVNLIDYTNLLGAFHATRGGVLPIFVQLYSTYGAWLPLLFENSLAVSKQEHQFWQITLRFIEFGFRRIRADAASQLDYGEWGIL